MELPKVKIFLFIIWTTITSGDVSHFIPPHFGSFFQHPFPIVQAEQSPFEIVLHPAEQPGQSLYGPPANQHHTDPNVGYLNPVGPSAILNPTPAPVASVSSTTTEFILPEIVENRSAKSRTKPRSQFIPLSSQYLPPSQERPIYESPKPPQDNPTPIQEQNDDFNFGNGYFYPRPSKSTTSTTTNAPIIVQDTIDALPEVSEENFSKPGYDYNGPLPSVIVTVTSKPSTPAPVYLPPSDIFSPSEEISSTSSSLRLRIQEMRCLQHSEGFFRAVLKVDSFLNAIPTVDNDSLDKRCEMKVSKSFVIADIAANDFQRCGIRSCGKDLCMRLRFPAIRGLRTSSDAILTLHCKTQDRIAVKTHALKMGVANDAQARNVGSYAHGGQQNPFRTHVELLRKGSNGFTRHLDSSKAVQLGEDLLLRAHVLVGDGWNFTKLSDVSLQRISPSGELLNSAILVTSQGCLNPSMQNICSQPPLPDPPLGNRFSFKAVMFQGMRSGEEMVLSMRIAGCLDARDCTTHKTDCSASGSLRRRRDTLKDLKTNPEVSEVSQISFRVIIPEELRSSDGNDGDLTENTYKPSQEKQSLLMPLIGTLTFVGLFIGLGIFASLKFREY